MSWRENLRPGSFRGVPFEVLRTSKRLGRRGAHFEFPKRDRGAVEDLGLKDGRFTLDVYVIGDDFIARRDALEAALQQPGIGELIHPTRGALQVIVDVTADISVRESARRGRMASFSIPFILSDDAPAYPSETAVSVAATRNAAEDVLASAAHINAGRIVLSGPASIVEAANADLLTQAAEVDALRPLAQGLNVGDVPAAALVSGFEANSPQRALDGIVGLVSDVMTVLRFGKQVLVSANGAALVARSLLATLDRDNVASPTSITETRIQANRRAIRETVQLAAISYSARALVEREFDSHGAALAALRDFDQAVEVVIRREADGGDSNTDTVAWRVSGGIGLEDDLIARNGVTHPMWCPAESVSVRLGRENVNA